MSTWKEYAFSEILVDGSISYGIVQPGAHTEIDSVPIIRVNNIKSGNINTDDVLKVASEIEEKYQRTRLSGGELLITVVGSVGECAIVPTKLAGWNVARAVSVARIKENFDKRFVKYSFKTEDIKFQMYGNTNDTVQPTLNLSSLKEIKFLIPPLPEQKAIASVLSSLDDKIDLLHCQNKTLEAIAETLFRQWFVEEAQENWELVKLESLINISSGKGLKKGHMFNNGAYPVLGANGEIGRTNDFLFDGKLLFTGRVGTLGNIFRVENEKVWLSDNTLVIRPINYFNFVYFLLKAAKLEEYNVGSTQPLIRQTDIKEIEINLPSEKKLHDFETKTRLLFRKIRQNQSQIRTIEKLRDTLLPKLMSSEVRVEYDAN